MAELDYFVVDVFTTRALEGNPLAVVFNTAALTTERMQAIAREFNLSETTFVERRPIALERAEGVRVRIFTAREELAFAGHPTLGTASVLRREAPETLDGDTLRLALNAGTVPVRFEQQGELVLAEMRQRDPEFGLELDPAEVARLIGLSVDDLALPPRVVSTGTAFAIVVLRSAQALARLRVIEPEASEWLHERQARWFYVLGPEGACDDSQRPLWRARMQFYGGEDPATGSAAGCAIAELVERGRVAPEERIIVRQGIEIGRPSMIFLSAGVLDSKICDVRVSGSTVSVANGRLFLP